MGLVLAVVSFQNQRCFEIGRISMGRLLNSCQLVNNKSHKFHKLIVLGYIAIPISHLPGCLVNDYIIASSLSVSLPFNMTG